jgi:hypothetical protein
MEFREKYLTQLTTKKDERLKKSKFEEKLRNFMKIPYFHVNHLCFMRLQCFCATIQIRQIPRQYYIHDYTNSRLRACFIETNPVYIYSGPEFPVLSNSACETTYPIDF